MILFVPVMFAFVLVVKDICSKFFYCLKVFLLYIRAISTNLSEPTLSLS